MAELIDACGRRIDYLRLSVTDRCDLRCTYCMPPEFDDYEPPAHWLSFDELERVARIFVTLGVSRIRLTGGEPLLRARINELARRLKGNAGLRDLSLSTNGTQLARHAARLRAAGVDRLNVSLDTLARERFVQITRRDALSDVLAGLESARAAGFALTKINMVWLPAINGDEVDAMIDYCRAHGFVLRLIENMPMGRTARQVGASDLQPLIARLRRDHGLVDHAIPGGGPARYLTSPDRGFSIGFITPLSQHFCDTCNRVRVTVDGELHLCLGAEHRIDLLHMMRTGHSDADIAAAIRTALHHKPRQHELREAPEKIVRFMSSTGG
ncbi:molybdenum cofactor biosynthesis protein MoaA [Stutzerimonas stutzeri]|uniref:GTP 3',8-cyclase MoaA n=1 Tax=Stutzerimonas stutzeri TaxID=316 RepID=UPI00222EE302|nr:GTP 3',8-cyclase MoaA [Stutzerimonas stutzeri]GBC58983.1 molybdenum cofactor biosynthesis protein MoaA [Stutzerimonas stutzeri]